MQKKKPETDQIKIFCKIGNRKTQNEPPKIDRKRKY